MENNKVNVGDIIYNMKYIVAIAKEDGYPFIIEKEFHTIRESEEYVIQNLNRNLCIYHKTDIYERVR